MNDDRQIDAYLALLRANLGPITLSEREEITLELSAHIRDSMEQSGSPVSSVLAKLGPAEELARQYREGLLLSRARNSLSPLLLLRAAFRLAAKGVSGVLIFGCGLFGYAAGGGLILTACLKPFFPAQTGLWIANGRLVDFGSVFSAQPSGAHEILGWAYLPLAFSLGGLILALTSVAIRALLRASKSFNARLRASSAFA